MDVRSFGQFSHSAQRPGIMMVVRLAEVVIDFVMDILVLGMENWLDLVRK